MRGRWVGVGVRWMSGVGDGGMSPANNRLFSVGPSGQKGLEA